MSGGNKLDAAAAWKQWGGTGAASSNSASLNPAAAMKNVFGSLGEAIGDANDKESLLGRASSMWKFGNEEASSASPADLEAGKARQPNAGAGGQGGNFFSRFSTQQDESGYFPTLSWNTRFKWFVICVLLSVGFFFLSFTFLPMIAFRPAKFALSFTVGSMLLQGSFAMLKGPNLFVKGLSSKDNLPFSVMYFVSLFLTLYACLIQRSYIMTVITTIFQAIALGWYGTSAIPGGKAGLKAFSMMFIRTAKALLQKLFS